jgi:hypothetical protein
MIHSIEKPDLTIEDLQKHIYMLHAFLIAHMVNNNIDELISYKPDGMFSPDDEEQIGITFSKGITQDGKPFLRAELINDKEIKEILKNTDKEILKNTDSEVAPINEVFKKTFKNE